MADSRILNLDYENAPSGDTTFAIDHSTYTNAHKTTLDDIKDYAAAYGTNGSSGTSGSSGIDGNSGATGASGESGSSGTSGVDGIDGVVYIERIHLNMTGPAQNINTGSTDAVSIEWDIEDYKDTVFSHSTSTNPERITVLSGGTYNIFSNLSTNVSAIDISVVSSLYVNGTEERGTINIATVTRDMDINASTQILTTLYLDANDYFEIKMYSVNPYDATDLLLSANKCEFIITRVSQASIPGGTSGTSGTSGRSGSSGVSGTEGTSGSSGESGSSGSSGVDGNFYGSSGTSGADGNFYGSSGSSGDDGTSGSSGILPGIGSNYELLYRDTGAAYGYNTDSGLSYVPTSNRVVIGDGGELRFNNTGSDTAQINHQTNTLEIFGSNASDVVIGYAFFTDLENKLGIRTAPSTSLDVKGTFRLSGASDTDLEGEIRYIGDDQLWINTGGTSSSWAPLLMDGDGGITINNNTNNNILTASGSDNEINGEVSGTFFQSGQNSILQMKNTSTETTGYLWVWSTEDNANGPTMSFKKGKSYTGTVLDNYELGTIEFTGLYSASEKISGSIKSKTVENWANHQYGSEMLFQTMNENGETLTDRIVIDGDGDTNIENGRLNVTEGITYPLDKFTADFTLTDEHHTVLITAATGRDIQLPAASAYGTIVYVIKNTSVSATHTIEVGGIGADTIVTDTSTPAASLDIDAGKSIILQSDGNITWYSWGSVPF